MKSNIIIPNQIQTGSSSKMYFAWHDMNYLDIGLSIWLSRIDISLSSRFRISDTQKNVAAQGKNLGLTLV